MSCDDAAFWQARLDKTVVLIGIYEDAIDAIGIGGAVSYTLDTGQSKQTVTKFDLVKLNETLDSLNNRYATIQARLNGCGVTINGPAF